MWMGNGNLRSFRRSAAHAQVRARAPAVTRLDDRGLRETGLERTQCTAPRERRLKVSLGKTFALESTTLNRTLRLPLQRGLIRATAGADRRESFSLTAEGTKEVRSGSAQVGTKHSEDSKRLWARSRGDDLERCSQK